MFGRTSSSAAFCISGWRNLNTISGSPAGEAVFVSDAPAQDEGMVVESEVAAVEEEDFPDPGLENRTLRDKIDTELLCGSRDKITVFEENLCRREPDVTNWQWPFERGDRPNERGASGCLLGEARRDRLEPLRAAHQPD